LLCGVCVTAAGKPEVIITSDHYVDHADGHKYFTAEKNKSLVSIGIDSLSRRVILSIYQNVLGVLFVKQ
jgi:hypothetical protein